MEGGNVIIIAQNIVERTSGSIREDAGGNIINHAGGRLIQTAEKGIKYRKYQKPKPPTDVRVTKLEGPFENIDGKPVDKIKLRTPYLYKASLTRKPSPIEEGFLRWAVQLDDDEKVLMNNSSSNQKVEENSVWLVITINKEFEKARVYAYFRAPSKKKSVQLTLKKVKFPMLVLQGSRRKGKHALTGADNKIYSTEDTAKDLLSGDYPNNANGVERLKKELYNETYIVEKQEDFYHTSREENAKSKSDRIITQRIKPFLEKTDAELFEIFHDKIEYFSQGDLEIVAHEMVNRMKMNKGGEYSIDTLTKAVQEHNNSKTFISAVNNIIKEYLRENKGNIEKLEIARKSEISKEDKGKLYDILTDKKIKPPYFSDKSSGLGITINSVWAYEVYITKYKIEGNNFEMGLEYIYWDHFGLDTPDIQKYGEDFINLFHAYDIFIVWFILEHFRGYKPFITKIKLTGELKGTF